jgi:hypothetical protein
MALWFGTTVVIERVRLSQTNATSDPKVDAGAKFLIFIKAGYVRKHRIGYFRRSIWAPTERSFSSIFS